MKVHILSSFDGPPNNKGNFAHLWLQDSATDDPFGQHELVGSPEAAELILFVENHASNDPYLLSVRRHPIYRRFKGKCFLYHDSDVALAIIPGVYPSIERRDYQHDRCRGGGYIARIAKNEAIQPRRDTGQAKWLYSFLGENNSHVRSRLLSANHNLGFVRDTTGMRLWELSLGPVRDAFTGRYAQAIAESKFVLCPRGFGPSTYRLFEAMEMGRCPVILSDQWMAPQGPAWEEFSIRIPESSVDNVAAILERYAHLYDTMGRKARAVWEEWFSKPVCFHRIVEACLDIQATPAMSFSAIRAWANAARSPHLRNILRSCLHSFRGRPRNGSVYRNIIAKRQLRRRA